MNKRKGHHKIKLWLFAKYRECIRENQYKSLKEAILREIACHYNLRAIKFYNQQVIGNKEIGVGNHYANAV